MVAIENISLSTAINFKELNKIKVKQKKKKKKTKTVASFY